MYIGTNIGINESIQLRKVAVYDNVICVWNERISLQFRSLRSRRKRGSGRGARTREKNGGLGPRDPFFFRSPSPSPFTPATQATISRP